MEVIKSNNITELYLKGLKLLKSKGIAVNSRAGKTLEILNAASILTDIRSRLILEPKRKHSLDYLKKEFIWYMSKSDKVELIALASQFWFKVSDDEKTVNSNYGKKIFTKIYDKTQYDYVYQELIKNPDSRRAVWIYLLKEDYAKMHWTKDFPCTISSQFFIRNKKLHQTVYMRSCDFIYGWCNDLPFFSLIQEMLAADLGINLGELTHIAGSLHIYEKHFELLKTKTKSYSIQPQKPFPKITSKDSHLFRIYPNWANENKNTKFMRFLWQK